MTCEHSWIETNLRYDDEGGYVDICRHCEDERVFRVMHGPFAKPTGLDEFFQGYAQLVLRELTETSVLMDMIKGDKACQSQSKTLTFD